MSFDKKILSEEDIKMKYITPAIENAGWDIKKQVRAEYTFTDGRVIVRGNLTSRGKKKRADYLLFYNLLTSYLLNLIVPPLFSCL